MHVERQHLREAWAKIYKYKLNMAAMLRRCNCSVILWSAERLFISATKTEERYIAKAAKSQ